MVELESKSDAVVKQKGKKKQTIFIFQHDPFLFRSVQGGPPEPWETAIGDTSERVGPQGRAVIDYAARMQAMGIDERSLAGETNPVADHVATIGREKMRLLSGAPSATAAAKTSAGVASARGVREARVGTSRNWVFSTCDRAWYP